MAQSRRDRVVAEEAARDKGILGDVDRLKGSESRLVSRPSGQFGRWCARITGRGRYGHFRGRTGASRQHAGERATARREPAKLVGQGGPWKRRAGDPTGCLLSRAGPIRPAGL